MRDYPLQTKDLSLANRRSKSGSDHSKKPQKISKKSLNSAFTAVSEDLSVFDLPKDLTDFTSISDDNQLSKSAENMTALLTPAASPASETVASTDLTPLSSTITSEKYKKSFSLTSQCGNANSDSVKLSCIEAELVLKHLKEALQSKTLLDALVNAMVEEFYGMPEERDLINELISKKAYLVILNFLLWILLVCAIFFFFSGSHHAFTGPTPT